MWLCINSIWAEKMLESCDKIEKWFKKYDCVDIWLLWNENLYRGLDGECCTLYSNKLLELKIVKAPIVADRKSKIKYNLWFIGSYNGDNSCDSYSINDEEKSRYIKANTFIKKTKHDLIYNNPSQVDESVCIAYIFTFV